MNVPLDRQLRPPTRLGEATAIALGPALSAVFFDLPGGSRERMQVEQDGMAVPRPFIAAGLALAAGGTRHVLFVPQDIATVLSRHLLLRLNGSPVAEIDPCWLQPPLGDLTTLTAPLSAQGLGRLLRMMLTTGASLFAADAQAGLAAAVPQIMDIHALPVLQPVAAVRIGRRVLVSHAAPALDRVGAVTDAVAMLDGRLIRLKDADCMAENGLLHTLLPAGLAPAQVVGFAPTPLRLAAAETAPRRLTVAGWMQTRSTACRDWLAACAGPDLAALASSSTKGAADPKFEIRHLSALPAGLLHVLVLDDPARRVCKVILERHGRQAELTPVHGTDGKAILAGFADLPSGPKAEAGLCRIRLLLHSGDLRNLSTPSVPRYDGTIPAGFEDAWALGADVLPALAQARAAFRRDPPPAVSQQFGPKQKCGLRIVTAIGSSVDLIRARAAMILAEAKASAVEVVCTMTDGPLAAAARHALTQTAAIYGIAHRLVLLPADATPAERLCVALAEAQDLPALVLGHDILPDGRGWLSFWLRRLRQHDALVPALLACDGAIAATRAGDDPLRGLPAVDLPAAGHAADRPLPDCLALGPAGIARLLASGPPHPDPALWVADALAGHARIEPRHPFRRFGPAAPPSRFAAALAETGFFLIESRRP